MASYRVLDPACGSGNILYVAYREMRRLEVEVKNRILMRRKAKKDQVYESCGPAPELNMNGSGSS